MKFLFNTTLFSLIAVGWFACKDKQKEEVERALASEAKKEAARPLRAVPLTIQDEALDAIFPHYVQLTEALVQGRLAEAKLVGINIEEGASEGNGMKSLKRYAAQIVAAPNLNVQRSAYAKLSGEMSALVKKAGVKNGTLYLAYCPMANENIGAFWLSSSKEIRNPFMGEKMLTCGEIKETVQ